MSETQTCPGCSGEYTGLGVHWSKKCGFPGIPWMEQEVFTGLLMGDAWIVPPNGSNKISHLEIASTSKEFLDHLHERLQPWVTKPRFYKTAEEVATSAAKAGMNADVENTNDQYILASRSHPWFDDLRNWYSEDGKKYPDDLRLTDRHLRYWYACDGLVGWSNGEWNDEEHGHIAFAASNEQTRFEWLSEKFQLQGVTPVVDGHKLRFNCKESKKLLEQMGEPVPGYEYKWEISDYERHYNLKQ